MDYLSDHLKGIPTYRAKLFVNGKFINDDHSNKWYSAPVELEAKGKKVVQRVGFRKEREDKIYLTSQGVLVKTLQTERGGATASFPPAVLVVEGRDELKMDKNYRKSIGGFFKAFNEYLKDYSKEIYFVDLNLDFQSPSALHKVSPAATLLMLELLFPAYHKVPFPGSSVKMQLFASSLS